jgi:hypothetical protein
MQNKPLCVPFKVVLRWFGVNFRVVWGVPFDAAAQEPGFGQEFSIFRFGVIF